MKIIQPSHQARTWLEYVTPSIPTCTRDRSWVSTTGARGRDAKLHTDQVFPKHPKDYGSPTYRSWTHQSNPGTCKRSRPRPEGFDGKFFQAYWSFLSDDFIRMVNESIAMERFPNRVTKGHIALLFKKRGPFELNQLATNHTTQHHLQDLCKGSPTATPTFAGRGKLIATKLPPYHFDLF